jgi:hypothetical protein
MKELTTETQRHGEKTGLLLTEKKQLKCRESGGRKRPCTALGAG